MVWHRILWLTARPILTDGFLRVTGAEISAFWHRPAACLIVHPDGFTQHALTATCHLDGGAVLVLRSGLDEPVPVGSQVIRLARCRLDHDAVDLCWHSPDAGNFTHCASVARAARQRPHRLQACLTRGLPMSQTPLQEVGLYAFTSNSALFHLTPHEFDVDLDGDRYLSLPMQRNELALGAEAAKSALEVRSCRLTARCASSAGGLAHRRHHGHPAYRAARRGATTGGCRARAGWAGCWVLRLPTTRRVSARIGAGQPEAHRSAQALQPPVRAGIRRPAARRRSLPALLSATSMAAAWAGRRRAGQRQWRSGRRLAANA